MTYTKTVYKNDEIAYPPKDLSADEMVELLARVCTYKQCGYDYEFHNEFDSASGFVAYHISFNPGNGDRIHQIITIKEQA